MGTIFVKTMPTHACMIATFCVHFWTESWLWSPTGRDLLKLVAFPLFVDRSYDYVLFSFIFFLFSKDAIIFYHAGHSNRDFFIKIFFTRTYRLKY